MDFSVVQFPAPMGTQWNVESTIFSFWNVFKILHKRPQAVARGPNQARFLTRMLGSDDLVSRTAERGQPCPLEHSGERKLAALKDCDSVGPSPDNAISLVQARVGECRNCRRQIFTCSRHISLPVSALLRLAARRNAVVEPPVACDGNPHQVHLVRVIHSVRIARFSTDVKAMSKPYPLLLEHAAGLCGFSLPFSDRSTSVQP